MQDYLATVHNANGAGTAGRLGNRRVVHGAIRITGMKSNYPKRRKERMVSHDRDQRFGPERGIRDGLTL